MGKFISDEEMLALESADTRTAFQQFSDVINTGADALTFGVADEAAAGVRSLLPGYQGYDEELAALRGQQQRHMTEHPGEAVLSALGGALIPTALTLGASAPASAANSARLVPGLARTAGFGAMGGGAYGFGSGEGGFSPRMKNAGTGAAIGAGGGAAIGGGAKLLGKMSQRTRPGAVSEYTKQALRAVPEGEAERITIGGGANPAASREAAKMLMARELSGLAPAEVQAAKEALGQAISEGAPMFLPEAASASPGVARTARYLANHNVATTDIAQPAIAARAVEAPARVAKQLDLVSPVRSVEKGAGMFGEGVEDIIGSAKGKVKAAGKPFEKFGRDADIFKTPPMDEVLKTKQVKEAVKKLKKGWPEEFGSLPERNFKLLTEIKGDLYAKATVAKRAGDVPEGKRLDKLRVKLTDAMNEALENAGDDYAGARKVYQKASQFVDKLTGAKGSKVRKRVWGVFEGMVEKDPRKSTQAVKELFKLDAPEIEKVRRLFGTEMRDEFRAGVRAWMQDAVEKSGQQSIGDELVRGPDLIAKMLPNESARTKLKSALGSGDYNELMRQLEREQQMHVFRTKWYHPGSSTAGNLEKMEKMGEHVGYAGKAARMLAQPGQSIIRGVDLVDGAFRNMFSPSDPAMQELTEAFFNPKAGLQMLEEIGPLQERAYGIGQKADELGRASAAGFGGGALQRGITGVRER